MNIDKKASLPLSPNRMISTPKLHADRYPSRVLTAGEPLTHRGSRFCSYDFLPPSLLNPSRRAVDQTWVKFLAGGKDGQALGTLQHESC